MNALAALQRSLQTHVLQPSLPAAASAATTAVVSSPAAAAAERLGVYTYAYRARLVEVLRNDFPGLCALAGAEGFESLASDYVDATPSVHYNVRWYGSGLAEFARTRSPWSAQPALAAMASLEWAMGLAFDAPAQSIVDFASVAAMAPQEWPGMRLRLHPSVQRQTLDWNVSAIRRAVDRDEPIPSLETFEPAQAWVIWRRDSNVRYRRLEVDEIAALDAAGDGATFAQLCELLCAWHAVDAVAARAALLLRAWIEDQWVGALE